MTYLTLDASNQVVQTPINTWGDSCFVLFGQADRDLINAAHQAMQQATEPAYAQKKAAHLNGQVTVLESLDEWIETMEPEIYQMEAWLRAIEHQALRYDFQYEGVSQLISLEFWGTMIAYLVHSVALKIWDLIDGTSQKAAEMAQLLGSMVHFIRSDSLQVGGCEKDGCTYEIDVSFPKAPRPIVGLTIAPQGKEPINCTVEHAWRHGMLRVTETGVHGDPAINVVKLEEPELMVTFDRDRTSPEELFIQLAVAIDLAKHEKMGLVVRMLSSQDGFQALNKYCVNPFQSKVLQSSDISNEQQVDDVWLWWLEKDADLTKMRFDETSWGEYFEGDFTFFNKADKRIFPDGLLFERFRRKAEPLDEV